MLIVEKALRDDDFRDWLEDQEKNGTLDYEYDQEQSNAYESGEEPDRFEVWALWRYLNNSNVSSR